MRLHFTLMSSLSILLLHRLLQLMVSEYTSTIPVLCQTVWAWIEFFRAKFSNSYLKRKKSDFFRTTSNYFLFDNDEDGEDDDITIPFETNSNSLVGFIVFHCRKLGEYFFIARMVHDYAFHIIKMKRIRYCHYFKKFPRSLVRQSFCQSFLLYFIHFTYFRKKWILPSFWMLFKTITFLTVWCPQFLSGGKSF